MKRIDTSDPGSASLAFAEASVLLARVLGYQAENQIRSWRGEAMAYSQDYFEGAISDFYERVIMTHSEKP